VRLGPPPRVPGADLCDWILSELHAFRARVGARVASVEGETSAGLLRALAIGDGEGLPRERIDLFARTGTSHLLAISGWHVGLFAALVVLPLARITPRARRSLLWIAARAVLLLLFAALAGMEKPVLRATLAILLLQLAVLRARGSSAPPRRPDGASFLAAAFALECLLDPAGIRTLSLSLSYAATLGLILGTGSLGAFLRPPHEPWSELAPASALRILARRLYAVCASGLAASAAAVLATLPLTWSAFGEFAPPGALLTLLSMPPFTFLSLLAWLAALVPWAGFTVPAELGARALYALLELGDALPGTPLLLPPRPLVLLLAATGTRTAQREGASSGVLPVGRRPPALERGAAGLDSACSTSVAARPSSCARRAARPWSTPARATGVRWRARRSCRCSRAGTCRASPWSSPTPTTTMPPPSSAWPSGSRSSAGWVPSPHRTPCVWRTMSSAWISSAGAWRRARGVRSSPWPSSGAPPSPATRARAPCLSKR
jgi:ComEC/Rec2-related protein